MAEGKSKTGVVKKRASKREKKDWIAAYIFIAPVTLGLLVFYIWPFIQNIWFSFNEVSKFNVATFCGLANYQKLFHDGEVLKTFGNTLKYVVVTVPVGLFLSILIAALLTPTIFFVMITSIISGFQVFDVIYMMIGKTNPAYANTQTVVMLFYRQAFDYGYKGYAAAISILIFAVIMLVTVIQMIGQKKWVNYD